MTFNTEIVFVRVLVPFICGIITAYYYPDELLRIIFLTSTVLFTGLLCLLNNRYNALKLYDWPWFSGIMVFLLLFSASAFLCLSNNQLINRTHFSYQHAMLLRVVVASEPQESKAYTRFTAKVIGSIAKAQQKTTTGTIMIIVKNDSLPTVPFHYGDELIVHNNCSVVDPPFNPAEFDFKGWLASQNIHHQLFLTQQEFIRTGENKGNILISYALAIRKRQIDKYSALIKDRESLAVASTLVLGYRADLDQETLAAYSKTGTIHALSVSGAHVAIIYLFLDYLFFFLNGKRLLKIIKVLLICIILWSYAMLTGFSPSVLRAVIMISVFIISKLLNKTPNNYNILAFSACCLLIYNPFLILDVGFQLSYLAVIGLIYLQPKIYALFYFKINYIDKFWNMISLSLAAQLITYPLSIYYFHQFPVYFLIGNLFIMLPVNLIMGMGTAVLIPGLTFLGPLFEWIITFTNTGLKWIASLPFSGISGIYITRIELLLLSITLLLFTWALGSKNKQFLFSSLSLLLIFQACLAHHKIKALEQRLVIFFTLKKHYATAFINGEKAIIVTDLTTFDKHFNFFIKPALEKLKIRETILQTVNKDTISVNFSMSNHQIRFYDYNILIYDPSFNHRVIKGYPKFSAIWIQNSPYIDINSLTRTLNCGKLIVDGTNRPYVIRKLVTDNNAMDISLLSKSPALKVILRKQ